eukprot:15378883-Alexandrium_andersonii.AAC.1
MEPWPRVLRRECVVSITCDRCTCGLRVGSGPRRGMFTRKRPSLTASCPELLYPFRDKMRPGRRGHLQMEGRATNLREAQVWTWGEAQRIVEGIQL